jgi:hypothetical protein
MWVNVKMIKKKKRIRGLEVIKWNLHPKVDCGKAILLPFCSFISI